MKLRLLSATGLACAVATMFVAPAFGQTTLPSATAVTSGEPANRPAQPIEAIRQAPDPSAAIEAYAKAVADGPQNDALREVFIQRMVEFGLPAMAESQARELVNRHPSNGLAWAVLSYANAARGQLTAAVDNMGHATDSLSNDEFVQRSAGQLLAWYDTMADLSKVPDATKQTVERIRNGLKDKAAFNETYQEAVTFYKNELAQAATTQPSTATDQEQTYVTPQQGAVTYQTYNYAVPYEQPYAYAPYTYYPSYYYPYYTYPYGYYDNFLFTSFVPDFCLHSTFIPFTACHLRGFGFHGFKHKFHDHSFLGFHHGFHKFGKYGFGFGGFGHKFGKHHGFSGFTHGFDKGGKFGFGFGHHPRGFAFSSRDQKFGKAGSPSFQHSDRHTKFGFGFHRGDRAFSFGRGRGDVGALNRGNQGRTVSPGSRAPTINRGPSVNRGSSSGIARSPLSFRSPRLTTPGGNTPSFRSGSAISPRQSPGARQFSGVRPPSVRQPNAFRSGSSTPSFNRSFRSGRSSGPAFNRSFGGGRSSGPAFNRSFNSGRSSGPAFNRSFNSGRSSGPAFSRSFGGGRSSGPAFNRSFGGGRSSGPAFSRSFRGGMSRGGHRGR